jgi:hypothetical protein
MHHIGSQEESQEQIPEEPQEEELPEVQAQEDVEEVELQECPDHRPSSFEKGKPQNIISLPLYFIKWLILYVYICCCIKYRSCLQPLMHIFTFLAHFDMPFYSTIVGASHLLSHAVTCEI